MYMRLAPVAAVERIYHRLYRMGRSLAGEYTKAETAFEFMEKLIARIDGVRKHSRYTNYLSSASQDIEYLTDLYQHTLFTDRRIEKNDVKKALNIWKHLRLRLFLARLQVAARRVIFPSKQSSAPANQKIASLLHSSQ